MRKIPLWTFIINWAILKKHSIVKFKFSISMQQCIINWAKYFFLFIYFYWKTYILLSTRSFRFGSIMRTEYWWRYFQFDMIYRDGQVHIFRDLDHSRSFPKNSEPHSLMLVNFFWAKIWATFTHVHSHSQANHCRIQLFLLFMNFHELKCIPWQ